MKTASISNRSNFLNDTEVCTSEMLMINITMKGLHIWNYISDIVKDNNSWLIRRLFNDAFQFHFLYSIQW
jgi:hypothetical protein